jgi:hypothetical protein
MSSPFRELFVELPRAVFESLQAIGEGAVAKAKGSGGSLDHSSMAHMYKTLYGIDADMFESVKRHICKRYGWHRFEMRRLETCAKTCIVAEFPCGHRRLIEIDDQTFLAAPTSFVDALDRDAERGRRCYCVQREGVR